MATKYKITTHTGENNSSTPPSITLGGTRDINQSWIELNNPKKDDFETDKTDDFEVTVPKDLGDIVNISLKGPNSGDFWSLKTIKITKQEESEPQTTIFTINRLLKGKETPLDWWADDVPAIPKVTLEPDEYSRKLFTEYTKIDNLKGDPEGDPIEQSVELHHEMEGMVSADRSKGATPEDSWFIQAGSAPPDATGGVTFSAGYAGSVVSSVENATHQSHRETITFKKSTTYKVQPGTCVIVQVDYFESGRTGNVKMFKKEIPINQANSLGADIKIYGTYSNSQDIPLDFRDGYKFKKSP
jgi:hypothetical protein